MSLEIAFGAAAPFERKAWAVAILAFFIGVLAMAQPANARQGGFGGVDGWGGLFRDNRDVGYFPTYVAYGDATVVAWSHSRRHIQVHGQGYGYGQIHRHSLRHRRAVAYRCAPEPHCICH
jgi:hypothetical protein